MELPTIEQIALEVKDKTFEMIEEETGVSFERLIQLAVADQERRCVVLPAKMGDDVWLIVTKRPRVTMPEFSFVKHSRLTWTNIERVVTEFGKTVFRTPEEAQAALERMKSNGCIHR